MHKIFFLIYQYTEYQHIIAIHLKRIVAYLLKQKIFDGHVLHKGSVKIAIRRSFGGTSYKGLHAARAFEVNSDAHKSSKYECLPMPKLEK